MNRGQVYSVSAINRFIKNMFSREYALSVVFVKGEISNCKYHSSGHIYFTLKDASSAISCVMFAGDRRRLEFRLEDGQEVLIGGTISVYERDGRYQLYAKTVKHAGEGLLAEKYEKLKKKLEEKGYFSQEHKKQIPPYAKRVGIVTAKTGAAIQDIINIATRRNPYVQLILYPARVQGEGACDTIAKGIRILDEKNLDVIIVGRGGGSIEDLWAFNEKIVAQAIFNCRIPIISAVGHETDWTIADFVADMRAPTPSAAAEIAVYDYKLVNDKLKEYNRRISNCLSNKAELYRQRLGSYRVKLEYLSPQRKLNESRRRLMEFEEKLNSKINMTIKEKRHRLELFAGKLEACSPVRKLGQGYAYVEKEDGKPLRSIKDICPEQNMSVYLLDGKIKTIVSEVISGE